MKQIILNCYARSSLTFTRQNMLNNLVLDDKNLIKTHNSASFSNINNQINIVRKPEGCIVSDAVMQKRNTGFIKDHVVSAMKDMANEYLEYHEKMLNHLDYILPFTFEQTTQNITGVIKEISNYYNIPFAINVKDDNYYLKSREIFLVSSKEAESYESIESIAKENIYIFTEANKFYDKVLLPSVLKRQKTLKMFAN